MSSLNDLFNDPLGYVGLGLIVIVFLSITLDVIVIPTMILSLASLLGWFGYVIYVYRQNPSMAFFLGGIFLILGVVYLLVIVKFKLWKLVAHQKKVPTPVYHQVQEIEIWNRGEVVAHTDLRPVGKIKAGGKTVDGLSEVGYIARGTPLVIIGYVEGQYQVKKKLS